MSESKSIILARQSIHTQTGLIVSPSRQANLCLLLVDRSTSMRMHGDTPRLAANQLIRELRTAAGAGETLLGVYLFSGEWVLEMPPVLAKDARDIRPYAVNHGTALFGAVSEALAVGLEFRGFAENRYDVNARVAVTVISDGEDTASLSAHADCLARARAARECGFSLQAIGIGIDSKMLSRLLGFDPELAHDVQATSEGVVQSLKLASRTFTTMMMGGVPRDTPTPPSGV